MIREPESLYVLSPLTMIKKTKKQRGKEAVVISYFELLLSN